MNDFKFSGTGVALITPFEASGRVDYDALAGIVDRTITGGADYLVVLGTTSEAPTLTRDERIRVAALVRECAAGRIPLVIGIGGNCTRDVASALQEWDMTGYDAVLSVNPYYNKPNQEGLYRHFKALSAVSPRPIILYNIQGRTGVNMLPETVARLAADCPNIIGIKEASGNLAQMERIRALTPAGFALISGDDGLTVEVMRRGGTGVISVVAQLYPQQTAEVVRLAAAGRFDEADARIKAMQPVIDALFEEGNPTGIKTAMNIAGSCGGGLRLPLVEGSASLAARLKERMTAYENGCVQR